MGGVVEGAEHARHVPGHRLRHPAFGERLGGLPLEVDQRPLPGRRAQTLSEVQVAVDALGGPGPALGREAGQCLERRVQPGRVGAERRYGLRRVLQALGHAVHQEPHLRMPQGGRRQGAGQRGVDLGRGPAQGPRLGDEVLALGHLAQREIPAVVRALDVGLEHAEDVRLFGHLGRQPRRGRGHPGAALTGQRQRELQVRVDSGDDLAQQFQDEPVAVDHGGVGLLAGQQAWHQAARDVLPQVPLEVQAAQSGLGAQCLQEHLGGPGVVQGLEHRASGERSAGDVADERGRQPGRQRLALAYQELVDVPGVGHGAQGAGLVGAHQQVVQAELASGRQQFGGRHQGEPGDRTPLAREPALPRQPLPQQGVQGREEARPAGGDGVGGCFRHGVASFPRAVGVE